MFLAKTLLSSRIFGDNRKKSTLKKVARIKVPEKNYQEKNYAKKQYPEKIVQINLS